MNGLSGGDQARYAGLLAMGSLVFLVVYGNREGGLLALFTCYLVGAGVLALALRHRRGST